MSFICDSEIYALQGKDKSVIGLWVSFEKLPEEIKVQNETLYFPNPFHISLVYIGRIIQKYNITIPDFQNVIIDDFCFFVEANPIEVVRYKNNEFRFVNRDGKKTVIVMCEVSNLDNFFDFMNEKYNLNIKYMTTHVTLYNTLKDEPGIYLMDEDDIKEFTTRIENPLGFELK